MIGSLCEYLSGGLVKGATHRVSNPENCSRSIINRRFSISYVLKPDYLYPAAPISLLERHHFSPSHDYAEIYDPGTLLFPFFIFYISLIIKLFI